jgi:hypothetical protein
MMSDQAGSKVSNVCARLVLLGAAGLLFLACAHEFHSAPVSLILPLGRAILIGAALVALVLAVAAVTISRRAARMAAIELIGLYLTLVLVELAITAVAPQLPSRRLEREVTAKKLDLPFDARLKSDVVKDLRAAGLDAYPGMSREWPRLPEVKKFATSDVYWLTEVANARIVECNEGGQYMTYDTDDLGFRNPAGLYDSGSVEIAAVGSSYTLGHCVPPEQTFMDRVRRTHPRMLNFGVAGSGALSMLATLREYVAPLHPPTVLWLMHPYIASDYSEEAVDPRLVAYLDPKHTQHLLERRAEIDHMLRKLALSAQQDMDAHEQRTIHDFDVHRWRRFPWLPELRAKLGLDELMYAEVPPGSGAGDFTTVMREAQAEVHAWGGKFIVVLLPTYPEVVARQLPAQFTHQSLDAYFAKLHIPAVDCVGPFAANRDPASLYTMRVNNHPDAAGHAVLATCVLNAIEGRVPGQLSAKR